MNNQLKAAPMPYSFHDCRHWLIFLCSLALTATIQTAQMAYEVHAGEVRVSTTDGRVFKGTVQHKGQVLIVRDAARHIYLSKAVVTEKKIVPATEKPPTYHFNQKLVRQRKKGVVGMVAKDWGSRGRFDANGITQWSLTDFKLGKIQFRIAITQLTPSVYTAEGVEYKASISFPFKKLGPLGPRLIYSATDMKDKDAVCKAIRFFILAEDLRSASSLLSQSRATLGESSELKQQAAALIEAQQQQLRKEIKTLINSGREEAALRRLQMERSDIIKQPPYAELLSAGAARTKLIQTLNLESERPSLSIAQARHLMPLVNNKAVSPSIIKKNLSWLRQSWVQLLDGPGITPAVLDQAIKLAEATATFFAQEKITQISKLATIYQKSDLPLNLKLAIFRTAWSNPAGPPPRWQKITYNHPKSGKAFHYYVQLPGGYDPSRPYPALLCLHGQTSKADIMSSFWGGTASQNGMVLISPEYIYGRKWGYKFSQEEHEAVLGALWHAARRVHIDMDRVYLQGHSQGGHATWDIGPAHAGRFAGIVPIIGADLLGGGLKNLKDSSLYAVDGSDDGKAPQFNRKSMTTLGGYKVDATYVEYQNRHHEAFYEEYQTIADWMLKRSRKRAPKEIHLHALRPCERRRHWLAIEKTDRPLSETVTRRPQRVTLEAAANGNQVKMIAKGVRTIRLFLSPDVFDLRKTITVRINSRRHTISPIKIDWRYALESSFKRRDRQEVFFGHKDLSVR